MPESKAPHARRVDPVGQVLVFAVLASVTYAIIEGPDAGWSSPLIVGLFVLSAAALAGSDRVRAAPRRSRCSTCGSSAACRSPAPPLIAVCAFAALAGFLFLNTLYLQDVRGYSPLHAGLLHPADGR